MVNKRFSMTFDKQSNGRRIEVES